MGGKDAPSRCRYNKTISTHWHVSLSHCPPPCLDSTMAVSFITSVGHTLHSLMRSGPNPRGVLTLCFSKPGSNCLKWGGLVKHLLSRFNVLGWVLFMCKAVVLSCLVSAPCWLACCTSLVCVTVEKKEKKNLMAYPIINKTLWPDVHLNTHEYNVIFL